MKKSILITLAAFAASLAFGQGTLTPSGAPAPTMKTLDQVEPRTPISSAPYTISEPGSYYLTTNLTSTSHGVVITTNGVTLDLMGFTLSGDGGSSDYGVFVDGATNRVVENVVVRNGAVNNFAYGIRAEYSLGGRFEQLALFDNTYYGLHLNGFYGQCDGNTIADCSISGNGNYGVFLDGGYGQCDGNTIADCSISGNSSRGVYLNGGYGQCDGNTIADCSISGNGSRGVSLYGYGGQCGGNTVADCTISGNGSYGVYLYGSYGQCDGNTVADCSISENSNYGVYLNGSYGQCDGNTVADCTIRKNSDRGIYLYFSDGNRVEGNHVTGQTGGSSYGIRCSVTADNLIIRNTCVGQTDNFVFDFDDTYGPEVTSSGAMATTNGAAALSPWANFSR